MFIDLSKAFDTVDHNKTLLEKLGINGIIGKNLKCDRNVLNNRKQYIQINNEEKTNLLLVKCGVPQEPFLGPLLFLIYINDLQFISDVLNSIIFADDTNLFYSHKDINALFLKVNKEPRKINQWFICRKLSLSLKKTKYLFFHKRSKQGDVPLLLPKLKINNYEIKRRESIKFLDVLIDESSTWEPHIKYIENKISKGIELLFKAKPFLNKQPLLSLHYSYIHSYINYANVAWGSTYITSLKTLSSQQKHGMRIIYNRGSFEHTKQSNKIPNVYKLNILNVITFMLKVN